MANVILNDLRQIFKQCISAVLPEKLIRNSLKYDAVTESLLVVDKSVCLKNRNVYIVGTGKAVRNMAIETEIILGPKINKGIISIPKGSSTVKSKNGKMFYFEGAENNLPDWDAEKTAIKVNEMVTGLKEDDLLIVLISGGGSALLPLPRSEISLDDKTACIKKLGNSGADIKELNTVRKKLSALKGGQLAIRAKPAEVISLVLSDIVDDPLDLIGSGPTTQNLDNPMKAKEIIAKYNLFEDLPSSIKIALESDDLSDVLPPKVTNFIIGSNKLSTQAAFEEANKLSYYPIIVSNTVTGNVRDVAREYMILVKSICNVISKKNGVHVLKETSKNLQCLNINVNKLNGISKMDINQSICLIFGGETTVEVNGKGKGGRNQQLALEFSTLLHSNKDFDNHDIFILSAGTDGIDGPTDAAGAIGYNNLVADATKEHLDTQNYLNNNDSYNFYKQLKNGDMHVITGHTNTNVMDIHLIIIKNK